MKYLRYLPPIWLKPGAISNNSIAGIYIGTDEKHPAAVLAQEYRENTFAWLTSYLPCLAGVLLATAGTWFLPTEAAIVAGAGIAILSAIIGSLKPVRAYRGIRGQVTEAVAAAWLYDVPLADEIRAAAEQLKGPAYEGDYGLEGKSIDEIEELCWRLQPEAELWVNNHRKLLLDGFDWLKH